MKKNLKKSFVSLILGLSSLLIFTPAIYAVNCPNCPQISNGGDDDTTGYLNGADKSGDVISTYTDNVANALNGTSNVLEIGIELAIIKEQRDLTGKVIASGAKVAKGQEIYYVLYVWNRANDDNTKQKATDVRIQDDLALTAGVTYISPSLQVLNNITIGAGNDPSTEANWTTPANWLVLAWAGASDAIDGDTACKDGNIIKAGKDVAQGQVDIDPRKTYVVRFRVRVN